MRNKAVVWSPRAKEDLRSIKEYFDSRNRSTRYSTRLLKLFRERANLIPRYPFASAPTDEENVRGVLVLDYILFFAILTDHFLILSVWDTRRDPDQLAKLLRQR